MKYLKKPVVSGVTRFTKAPMADVEFSRMTVAPDRFTTFNAGEIVPIYYEEILPHDTFSIDLDYIVRQTTLLKPVMGDLNIDIYAFWVPNRVVNDSWKNVQGENTSGFWTAPEVDLAPLYTGTTDVQINPESVADYYGFPTQAPIKAVHLQQMNDLKFKGYLACCNRFFRDENYQSPIPFSKLNIYQGFLDPVGSQIGIKNKSPFGSSPIGTTISSGTVSDGSFPSGSIVEALYGEGSIASGDSSTGLRIPSRVSMFSANDRPLKANKYHDPFTSVLPAPQKGAEVVFGVGETAPVTIDTKTDSTVFPSGNSLKLSSDFDVLEKFGALYLQGGGTASPGKVIAGNEVESLTSGGYDIKGSNLSAYVDLSQVTGVSINDLRTAVATQQVYESLARGGSRYLEIIRSFFEIETETPFVDDPIQLGHIRNVLDMYQVAQTSSSQVNETPQGNLTAFGYTTKGGKLFNRTFLEHGYVHVFAVVRQKKSLYNVSCP